MQIGNIGKKIGCIAVLVSVSALSIIINLTGITILLALIVFPICLTVIIILLMKRIAIDSKSKKIYNPLIEGTSLDKQPDIAVYNHKREEINALENKKKKLKEISQIPIAAMWLSGLLCIPILGAIIIIYTLYQTLFKK